MTSTRATFLLLDVVIKNLEQRNCQNCKNQFTIEPEDFLFYEKIKVPPPTWCPECRLIRRMAVRNEQALYRRKDAFGKELISALSLDKPVTVYEQKYWWSDKWDPMDYGQEYDFSKPFFRQFKELRERVPMPNLSNVNSINSDYSNVATENKDCYLVSATGRSEKILYGNRVSYSRDSMDLLQVDKVESCYENLFSNESFRLFFSKDCERCVDSAFLYDCHNCSNCFGCTNLRNKSYCIFNRQYSKEEYEEKMREFDLGSFVTLRRVKELFENQYKKAVHRYAVTWKTTNAVGDHINESKNCHYCFDVLNGAEDCKFIEWSGWVVKDSYDALGAAEGALIYESVDVGIDQGYRLLGVHVVYSSHEVSYSVNCHNSSYLFGCVGLRNKQYCILNKQYAKEEYEKLVPRIIQHMNEMPYVDKMGRKYAYGEFFPTEHSLFAYNETIAQDYFPLTKDEALNKGYAWKDPEDKNYVITVTSEKLPDHVRDVTDSILQETIGCQHEVKCNEQCTTAFKVISQELEFYRKMSIALPRLCPNCRHGQRLKLRNPLKLWHRQCTCGGEKSDNGIYTNQVNHFHGSDHCPNEFETSYAPERPEIVYCEQCYQTEVI